jgi:thiamine pyrophosphokinase
MPAEGSQLSPITLFRQEEGFLRLIIIANGEMHAAPVVQPGDTLIAADGGARHCQRLGLIPNLLIGDFDSLDEAEVSRLQAAGTTIIRHPQRKDATDLELALSYALQAGYKEALVYGALGARWDQTLANLLLPASEALQGLRIVLVDGDQEIRLLRPGHTYRLSGQEGDLVSLIPIHGDVHGIQTQGLEYPLLRETLFFGSTRGVSNLLRAQVAQVSLEAGLLLCVLIHGGTNAQA